MATLIENAKLGRSGVCGALVRLFVVYCFIPTPLYLAMRRNADLFVMLTTMNLTTLDHIYKEFASIEWRSFVDFCANMLKNTEDYGRYLLSHILHNLTR